MSLQHRSIILPLVAMALILSLAFPSSAAADEELPTSEPTVVVTTTPEVTPNPPESGEVIDGESARADESESTLNEETDVVLAESDTLGESLEDSPYELVTSLPIWCPVDVEPIAGQ